MIRAFSDIQHIQWKYESMLYKVYDELEPVLRKAYKMLEKDGHFYDVNKTTQDNLETMWSDDHSIHAAILKGCKRGKAMFFSPDGSCNFVVLFIDKKYTTERDNIGKGVRIFRVFEEIDLDCIENTWNLNTTNRWITKSNFVTDTFTDVTEFSQVIDERPVCERPTIKRLFEDLNDGHFKHYGPIFCTCTRHHLRDFSLIEYCINNMILLCVRLELTGVEL